MLESHIAPPACVMPALTVTRQEIDRMIAILGEVLKEFSIATEVLGGGRRRPFRSCFASMPR